MQSTIEQAAATIGAIRADIPGLWHAPGYPELTTGQLLDAAKRCNPDATIMVKIDQLFIGAPALSTHKVAERP